VIVYILPLLLFASLVIAFAAFYSSMRRLLYGEGDLLQVAGRFALFSGLTAMALYLVGCVMYYGGLGGTTACAHDGDFDERLISYSLIPLSTRCTRGGGVVETVPNWFNPVVLALLLVSFASLSAWFFLGRSRRRP
jgi:hypothetical protein